MSSGTDPVDGPVTDRLATVGWPGVVAAGAGAFLAGYLLTVLVVVLGPSSTAGGVWGVLVLLAFVFYSAHNVAVEAENLGRVDMLEQSARDGTAVPVVVFYAIPILVLLVTAALVTARYTEPRDPIQSVGAIAGLTGGYALLSAAGTVVFTSQTVIGAPARLVLGEAVAFGVVYPVVFGTIGAALVGVVAVMRDSE